MKNDKFTINYFINYFKNKSYFLLLTLLFCINASCESVTHLSKIYISYKLNQGTIPELSMKHKSWKMILDSKDCKMKDLFTQRKCVYKIRYFHEFDSISIPKDCEVYFCGGSLKGKIKFNDNYLSGRVIIKNSEISGTISNKVFEAGWICNGDGVYDDAKNINMALAACPNIHFQKGTYLMECFHNPYSKLSSDLYNKVKAHIGIYRTGVTLLGDDGASFLTKDMARTITIYSLPNQVEKSIKNIKIQNIDFRVVNDSRSFDELSTTIKTIGVNGLIIKDCSFFDFWSDAICLCHYGDNEKTGERTRNSNVTIANNYIEGSSHNNRNAISVINGYNVLIDHNVIEETSKDNMPGAIDIEPNNSAYTINKITISNNSIFGSKGNVGAISVVALTNNAPAHNITIKNNFISNSTMGIVCYIKSHNTTSNFSIIGNTVDFDTPPFSFKGRGTSKNWTIKHNTFKRPTMAKIGGDINITNLKVE